MIAEVIVDIANSQVDRVFDYLAHENTVEGQRVLVPFGNRNIEGFVIRLKEKSDLAPEKLKSILRQLDDLPLLSPEFLSLSEFMIKHNHLRRADIFRLFLPSGMRQGRAKALIQTKVAVSADFNREKVANTLRKNSKKQFMLLEILEPMAEFVRADLNRDFGAATVKKFIELGILKEFQQQVNRTPTVSLRPDKVVKLTPAQEKVLSSLNQPRTHVLFGVTGSGKTEIYMRYIQQCLDAGKTAIMLVPEIGLTPQMIAVFQARFGEGIAILHSKLGLGERFDEWQRIRRKEASIVIGARSAIFAPLENIGVIIIDEEHDSSYRSESNPRFSTHDIAEFRAKWHQCPLILGSATPSVETFFKAKQGEYNLLELPKRINDSDMPQVQIVDMITELSLGNTGVFSRQLQSDLTECIRHGNQAMLFINRRGFSSFTICRECGYTPKCDDCDVALVYHKEDNQLKCHFCNKRYKALTNCPNCGSSYLKMGAIGTQRVVEELKSMFPEVKILRMDHDVTGSKKSHAEILEEFANTSPSILVGTQMIAKGHDFPNITLVGIVDADMGLHFADFRSSERTFQVLTQVAGRAGRADKLGKVVLQTYMPKHYVYRFMANYDFKAFFERELNLRETAKFPPFAQIVRILISSEEEGIARDITASMNEQITKLKHKNPEIVFAQAMKSPVTRIQRKFRYQILLRVINSPQQEDIIQQIYTITDTGQHPKASIFVELNPTNMS